MHRILVASALAFGQMVWYTGLFQVERREKAAPQQRRRLHAAEKQNEFAVAVGLLGLGFTGMTLVSLIGCSLMTMAAVWTTNRVTTDLLMLLNDISIYGLGLPVLLAVGHFLPDNAAMPLRPKRALRPFTFARAAAVAMPDVWRPAWSPIWS